MSTVKIELKPHQVEQIKQICKEFNNDPGELINVLHKVQHTFGYLPAEVQEVVASELNIPVAKVYGVVTFYSFFTTQPRGRHTIKFCLGTACYVGGTPQLIEKAKQLLGIEPGQTTPDGEITLELCRCVGACSQAPVVVVDEQIHGRLRPNKFPQVIRSVQNQAKDADAS